MKFIELLIIVVLIVMAVRFLFRMFLKKVANSLTPPGQHSDQQQQQAGTNVKEPKRKIYDPDKIEDAKFEELK